MTSKEYEDKRRSLRKGDYAIIDGKLVKIVRIAIDSDGSQNFYEAFFVYVDDENGYTFHTDIMKVDLVSQPTAKVLYDTNQAKKRKAV